MLPIIATVLTVTFGVACYYAVARRRLETREPKSQIFEMLMVTTGLLAVVHLPSFGLAALIVLSSIAVILAVAQVLARWAGREALAGTLRAEVERPSAENLKSGAIVLLALSVIVPYVMRSPLLRENMANSDSGIATAIIYLLSATLVALAAATYVCSRPVEVRDRGIVSAWRAILWSEADSVEWKATTRAGRELLVVQAGKQVLEILVPHGQADEVREWMPGAPARVAQLESVLSGLQPEPPAEPGEITAEFSTEDVPLSSPVEKSGN